MATRWFLPLIYFMLFDKKYLTKAETGDFNVIWSVPFNQCKNKVITNMTIPLIEAGVSVNEGSNFQGNIITTFYKLGLYPQIGPKGDINGGIPQLANLTNHFRQVSEDILKTILNESFSGLALIDWESWRPTWDFNFGSLRIYQKRSLQLVAEKHPDWPLANQTKEAKRQWEQASRLIMEGTIQLAKKLRPKAKWCFYGFPDSYNYNGKEQPETYFTEGSIMQGNDGLQWLWEASTALCPSIYIYNQQLEKYNMTQRSWYTNGRLLESNRVSGFNSDIYPYINYYVFDGGKTLSEEDFRRLLGQSAVQGLKGVVIWGSSNNVANKTDCAILSNYIDNVISPAVKMLLKNLKLCSQLICKGNGTCVWSKRSYQSWKTLFEASPKFDKKEIVCVSKPI